MECLKCKEDGLTPIEGEGVQLVFNPRMTMPGPPTIEGHRLGAEFLATYVYHQGIDGAIRDYELKREELLVACWWVGRGGPRRKITTIFREWASVAGAHLWHGCINIPDPPLYERA